MNYIAMSLTGRSPMGGTFVKNSNSLAMQSLIVGAAVVCGTVLLRPGLRKLQPVVGILRSEPEAVRDRLTAWIPDSIT